MLTLEKTRYTDRGRGVGSILQTFLARKEVRTPQETVFLLNGCRSPPALWNTAGSETFGGAETKESSLESLTLAMDSIFPSKVENILNISY